jgi:hypothetical protein
LDESVVIVFGCRFHGTALLPIQIGFTARFVEENAPIDQVCGYVAVQWFPLTGQNIVLHD